MPIEIPVDKWPGSVREVALGATSAEGGTRTHSLTVGGGKTMPYLQFEAPVPHKPVIAVEIYDARVKYRKESGSSYKNHAQG